MNFKIFLLLSICVSLKPFEIMGLKRIKRNTELNSHNRIKEDFIVMDTNRQEPIEMNDQKIAAAHEIVSNLRGDCSIPKNLTADAEKKRNTSRSLTEILREREHKYKERQREDRKAIDETTADLDSKIMSLQNKNLEKSSSFMQKRYDAEVNSKEPFMSHKIKRLPHVLRSTGVVEAKVVIPPHPLRAPYRALNPFASLGQLMDIGNMMMVKVGMDAAPYSPHPSKMITQNVPFLPEKQSNEPNLDYIFNSIDEGPQENYFNLKAPLQANPQNTDDNLQTHTIIYKPLVAAKEPTPLANFMRNALDSLLANSGEVEGDKNENEIEISCPVHHERKRVTNEGDNTDLIQVCSCRFIKRAKEDEPKKRT